MNSDISIFWVWNPNLKITEQKHEKGCATHKSSGGGWNEVTVIREYILLYSLQYPYVYIYTYLYLFIHLGTCIYTCMYIYMHLFIYIYMYKPWGTNLRFRVDNVTQQKLLRLSSGHGVVIYQASGTTNGHQGVQQLGMCAGPCCTTVLKGSSACSKRRECEKQKLHFFEDSFDSSSFCVIFMMFHPLDFAPSKLDRTATTFVDLPKLAPNSSSTLFQKNGAPAGEDTFSVDNSHLFHVWKSTCSIS